VNDWSRVPKLVPSRQLARDILKTGKKLLETIEQHRVNLKENGPKTSGQSTAIYHAAIELSGLLNPRKYPFDVFREIVLNAIGWPPELVQGLRKIQSAVCSIRRECNWVNDPIPKPSDPPTNVNDIEHDPFECTICIFPQLRKAISNIHTSKINEGLELLQKALEKSQSTKPDNKTPKRGRKVDKATIRRADFAKPPREKGESWPNIYAAYNNKYPRDVDASEDVLRRAFERQYPEIAAKLKEGKATE